ncbi:MAG TPA: SNF2-related protein [Acidobacteriota bacterium]|nr:SNF2-related protein [Acidobacteriota bacterium]
MSEYRTPNFNALLESRIRDGQVQYKKYLQSGKVPLQIALEEARKKGLKPELINRAEEKGMIDGSLEMTYEGADRILKRINDFVKERGDASQVDYAAILGKFDSVRDHDLIATGLFCLIPEVREKVANKLETLYRVVLNVGTRQRSKTEVAWSTRNDSEETHIVPESIRSLLTYLPTPQTSEDEQYQRALKTLVKQKIERDVFLKFHTDAASAFSTLSAQIAAEQNPIVREVYLHVQDVYKQYSNVKPLNANPKFLDPEFGTMGTLPSLHQKIGMYHLMRDEKFGIFDGCGTGKTAIATLAQPMISAKEGKTAKTIIVCPNNSKKAWKTGLCGEDAKRYLDVPAKLYVFDGEAKTDTLLADLKAHDWILVNYEQLLAKTHDDRLVVDVLREVGADFVIADEAHRIKSRRIMTANGKPTQSAAFRTIANSAKYLALLSGSPIPDSLDDYAVLYSLLNPTVCPTPEHFDDLYQKNPRILYTLFHEKTVRRTSNQINAGLESIEFEDLVPMTDVQRTIYDHIVQTRPQNWLIQARKAILDPRLVDPRLLAQAGVLGQVDETHSAKYRKLEEILTAADGPLEKGESFVVFSSTFKQGVTRGEHEQLRQAYEAMGESEAFSKLNIELSLDKLLERNIRAKSEKKFNMGIVDGNIPDIIEREHVIERLGKDLDGILCTTETGGESLNCTAANHVIFLDDDYTPKTQEQAIARVLRKGQKKKVNIHFLRTAESLDEPLRDYVARKAIITQIAIDGFPLTLEEKALLNDTKGQKLGDLIKQKIGGVSIDTELAKVESIADYEIKRRSVSTHTGNANFLPVELSESDAQKLRAWMARDPNCWNDPDFVAFYIQTLPTLSVPVMHQAKISDLISRAKAGQIVFPRNVLSEGAGPSLLFEAYRRMEPIILQNGLVMPTVVDRDIAPAMIAKATNPNRILGDMRGIGSELRNESFDMVDHQSITLLANPHDVYQAMLETQRVLRQNGILEIVIKDKLFKPEFYSGLGRLGFEVLTEKDRGFTISKSFFKRLKNDFGEHFAQSYASKLNGSQLLIAKKVDTPTTATAESFWFLHPEGKVTETAAELATAQEAIKAANTPKKVAPPEKIVVNTSGYATIEESPVVMRRWSRKNGARVPRGGWKH